MKKRTLCLLFALALLFSACAAPQSETLPTDTQPPETVTEPPTEPKFDITGEELMQEMKIGWNLGNTFDAPDGETSWGNPLTTPELLQAVKALGFNTIRIPISWGKHVSPAPEYTIEENFLKRVTTVVDQALDAGLYVIINSHHDNHIYSPTPDNAEAGMAYLSAVWTQVAENFKDRDHHLIFQTMNEPRVQGSAYEWWVDTKNEDCMASVEVVNQLNQAALDAIRATGGNNGDRFVIISPYAGNHMAASISRFKLPADSAEGRLIISVHAYTPYDLCLNTDPAKNTFDRKGLSEIRSFMGGLHARYVSKGIPVILDEMGCVYKENDEVRYQWAKNYIALAKEHGMVCCWWDNGSLAVGSEGFGLINRYKCTVYEKSQQVYQGLMEGLTAETE